MKKIIWFAKVLLLSVSVSLILPLMAFAETALDEAGTGFADGIEKFYSTWLKIVLPIAFISFAAAGIMMFFSDEKGVKKAIKHACQVIVAIAVLSMLPLILNYSFDLFRGIQWDPEKPSEGAIVQENPDVVNNNRYDNSEEKDE